MANVLKTQSEPEKAAAVRSVSGLAGFNLNDFADEGRSRLEQCRTHIRGLLDEAKAEAVKIRKLAEDDGYQTGLRRAEVDAEKKLQQAAEQRAKDGLKLIGQAVEKLHVTYDGWMQEYSRALHGIALASAEKIVRRKLDAEPEILLKWAEEALTSTRTANRLVVAVHPETLALLGEALDQMLASPDFPEKTHVEPDESLARDAVVIRQLGGEIQAGLESQLARLQELLS